MHAATFDFVTPPEKQMASMAAARLAFSELADKLGALVPDGPDKTFVMRELRGVAMWVNVAITRNADGSPRTD